MLLGIAAALLAGALLWEAAPARAAERERTDLSTLTRQQLAGQRAIYSYPGLTPPPRLLQLIRNGRVGGVIFYGANISSKAQIRAVIDRLQAAQRQSVIREPLLITTDQEGGLVRRVPGAPVLSEAEVGASGQVTHFGTQAGTNAGINLRQAGVNVNLAPVLGVYRQPGDFLDRFQRAYSMLPGVASAAGSAFVAAQQRKGVAATIKHFPGLGAAGANQDTDVEPVTLHLSLETLRTVDLIPYPASINAGARMLLSSWAVYPALDPNRPAGLSKRWMQDELRGRLRYRGVTITDAIEAGALEAYGRTPNRAVLAADAGQDLLLFSSRSISQGIEGRQGLARALQSGRLNQAEFMASVRRVMQLRADLAKRPKGPLPAPR